MEVRDTGSISATYVQKLPSGSKQPPIGILGPRAGFANLPSAGSMKLCAALTAMLLVEAYGMGVGVEVGTSVGAGKPKPPLAQTIM